ncbi:MAG: tetratricopeptide repeat protein [Spirochaetales bacterium]|nr:tetratricopeptide repeat protein [Spirochaetales bacterium]
MKNGGARVIRILIISVLALAGCDREDEILLDDLLELEDGETTGATVDELKDAIGLLKKEVERTVEAGIQLVSYYKSVGQQYMRQELFGLAADFYRKALDLQPGNPLVAYRLGVCTSQVARSQPDETGRIAISERALEYHRYALQLDPGHADALYAASVLCIFELDRIGEAEGYLERLLASQPGHVRGMFLLARVYSSLGEIDDAVALYDRIIRDSGNEEEIEQAKTNRAALIGSSDVG